MRRVAKNFYIGSWIASCSLILFFEIGAWVEGWEKGWSGWSAINFAFVLPLLIYLSIVCLVLLYKFWVLIEDYETSISPGKALGFMFIPFFNIYWIFRVVGGFAGAFNSFIKRHSISVSPLPRGIFLAFCIHLAVSGVLLNVVQAIERSHAFRPLITAGLFVVSAVISLIIGTFVIAKACQGVNSIVETAGISLRHRIQAPQGQEISCPCCQTRSSADARFCFMCGMKFEMVKTDVPTAQAAPFEQFGTKCDLKTDLDAGGYSSAAIIHVGSSINTNTVEPAFWPGESEEKISVDQDLAYYVTDAEGTNLKIVNICMAVGLFVLGWLVWVVYFLLGKPYRGLIYFIPVFILYRFALGSVSVIIIVLVIWAVAWFDANRILKKYHASAELRLNEINLQPDPGVNLFLEKGILMQKVFGRRSEALDSIKQAMTSPGGNPVLWALAGIELVKQGAFSEAKNAFNRSNGAQGGRAFQNRLRAYKKKVAKKLGVAFSHINENMRG